MKSFKKRWLGLAFAALAQPAWAQLPAPPAAPALPAGAPGVAGVPAPLPGGKLGNLILAKEYCKAKFCSSTLGQLINNSLKPVSVFSGGALGSCCPPNAVNPADLAKPADTPSGLAARIKADEADAAKRRADVRYLGTVDCRYWPEAPDALVNALRADRNECVRWEAAMALGSGCCCNAKTVTALSLVVAGGEEDGNPAECSERVKVAAHAALAHCLTALECKAPLVEPPLALEPILGPKPEGPKPEGTKPDGTKPDPEKGDDKSGASLQKTATPYYKRVEKMPVGQVIDKARRTLAKSTSGGGAVAHGPGAGHSGVVGLVMSSMGSSGSPSPGAAPVVPEPAVASQSRRGDYVQASAPRGNETLVEVKPSDYRPIVPVPVPMPMTAPPAPQPVPVPAPAKAAVAPPQKSAPKATTSVAQSPLPTIEIQSATPKAPQKTPEKAPVIVPVSAQAEPAKAPAKREVVVPAFDRVPTPQIVKAAPPEMPMPMPKVPELPAVSAPVRAPIKQAVPSVPPPVLPAAAPAKIAPPLTLPAVEPSVAPPVPPAPTPAAPMPAVAAPVSPPPAAYADAPAAAPRTPPHLIPGWMLRLRTAFEPTQREAAATQLGGVDWRSNPQVVELLLTAAEKDSAVVVQVASINSLSALGVDTIPVVVALEGLRSHRDPRVQGAAGKALAKLASSSAPMAAPTPWAGAR